MCGGSSRWRANVAFVEKACRSHQYVEIQIGELRNGRAIHIAKVVLIPNFLPALFVYIRSVMKRQNVHIAEVI